MSMMLTVYCPICYAAGRNRESIKNSLACAVFDICTDHAFDLEGRDPYPGEEEEAIEDDERIIREEVVGVEHICGLCGHTFRINRDDPQLPKLGDKGHEAIACC